MAVAEKVTVELELKDGQYQSKLRENERAFQRSMDATKRAADDAARDIQRTLGRVPDELKRQYRELGHDIGVTLSGVSRGAQIAFGALTAYSLKLAMDAQEIESAFQVAFGTATDGAKAFSEQLAETAGRDAVVLREGMTRLQLVLTGTGVAAEQATQLVQRLAEAGVDAGSLFNTSDAEALQKIISGISGEAEPLKAFGVVLTEAAVKAELLRLGFKGNAESASEAAKSIARTNLILKGLSVAQGDAARTADSAANTTKRMTAEFNQAARELGTELLPALVKVFGAATDVLEAFNALPGGMQVAGLAMLALIAAGGPIAGLISGLGRLRALAISTRAALIGLGAGGGAAAAGGALGGTAVVGAGLLLGTASFAPAPSPELDAQIDRLQKQIADRDRMVAGMLFESDRQSARSGFAAQDRRLADLLAQRSRRNELQQGLHDLAYGVTPDPNAAAAGLDAFGLGDLANGTGTGAGRGPRGARGPSAEEIERRRETLRLQNALNLAQSTGNQLDIDRAQRAVDVADMEERFAAAHLENARALAEAHVDAIATNEARVQSLEDAKDAASEFMAATLEMHEAANREIERRLRFQLDLATQAKDETEIRRLERELALLQRINDLGPGGGERAKWEQNALNSAEDRARLNERGAAMASSFMDLIRSEDIGEEMGRRFQNAAFDNLEAVLSQIFAQVMGQNAGSNWLSSAANFLGFGGGRASGGNVRAGFAYDVGESGRERFIAPANGVIIPNMGAKAVSSSPSSVVIRQSFDLTGVNGDAAIYANVSRMIQQGQRQTVGFIRATDAAARDEHTMLRE